MVEYIRDIPEERIDINNTEAIATLFHLPTAVVLTAPHIRRIESRKGGPPAGLAIFGDEEEIEKFK